MCKENYSYEDSGVRAMVSVKEVRGTSKSTGAGASRKEGYVPADAG